MKKTITLITATALAGVMSLMAQSKISPMGTMILEDLAEQKATLGTEAADPVYATFVNLMPGCTAQSIADAGFEVVSDLGEIITVNLPLSRAEELAQMPEVKYVDFGSSQQPTMKFARPAGGVDEAHAGITVNGATHSFDGSGVIAGLMDTGMDANHCNFKTDDNVSRVERLWWFRSTTGTSTQYTSATMSSFSTDTNAETHATHVGGIMGGSYKGSAQVAQVNDSNTGSGVTAGTDEMPYYGVATGSALAFSVGSLSDANIINGVTKIVEYAEQQGKPCVVNMSLGSNSGPHDGTSSYCQSLAALGKRAIICMSAGNEGASPLFVTKEFSSASDDLKTMIDPSCITNGYTATGIVDIWGKSDKVLAVSWAVYNASSKTLNTIATITKAGSSVRINSSNSTFNSAFSGSISLASEINPNNNRFHVQCTLSAVARKTTASTSYLALIVKSVEGDAVYVYGSSTITFTSNSLVGWTTGSTAGTINDGACAENIISVGAFTSARWFPCLNRRVYSYQGATANNTIAPFSSYGKTFQGVAKPDVTGPGTAIISSYSRYYISAQKLDVNSNLSASATRAGVTNYWGPMQGTSMSCPFMSGTVALWLQANPNLDYNGIMDVIKNSSDYNSVTMRPAEKWGAGTVNAAEGLKYILTQASIGSVANDDPAKAVVLTPCLDGYEIAVAGTDHVNATLHNIAGFEAARVNAGGNNAFISTSGLQSGVYILSVDTPAGRYTTKLAVK